MRLNSLFKYNGAMFKFNQNIRFSSEVSSKTPIVRFDPNFPKDSKIIMPISFSRYLLNGEFSIKRAKEYDSFLNTIFQKTAYLLKCNLISSIDILSTGDHQRICWDNNLTNRVEQHFLNTHEAILSQQSNILTLNQWISRKGEDIFNKRYERITIESLEGTNWYDLMLKTHSTLKMSGSIEKSLEYQRKEYAAMSLMNEYTHLVYTGSISIAWAYLYQKYDNVPIFSQARVERSDNVGSYNDICDSEPTTKTLLVMIKDILASSKFPPDKKESLANSCMGLFYAYGALKSANHTNKIPIIKKCTDEMGHIRPDK